MARTERLKVRSIARFKRKRGKFLVMHILVPGVFVVNDGPACFRGVADAGCEHYPIVTGSGL